MARRNYCPAGYKDITDLIDGRDVTWAGGQPGGTLTEAMNDKRSRALDVIAERLDELYSRGNIDQYEYDDRLEMLDRVEAVEARFVHTGPGLMGDDYTLHLCVKLKGK